MKYFLFCLAICATSMIFSVRGETHDFCEERLKLDPLPTESSFQVLINANGALNPVDPPLILETGSRGLFKFFQEFENVLRTVYPELVRFYAIHDGNPTEGYHVEVRVTLQQPPNSRVPGAVVWIPGGGENESQKTPWRGNCFQGGDQPIEGIVEEIFSPGQGPNDNPLPDDYRPESQSFLAYLVSIAVNQPLQITES